ncbi:MAG: tyrosine recombinase XerD, partial [Acidimicrobiaceae bacterium]|nr:tyrosine recombinase XerD [Acidimicrobiaceae bacterium]
DPLDTFMTWIRVEQGRSLNTLTAYERDLNSYLIWLTKQKVTMTTASVQHLERFVAFLRASGKAPKSVARHFAAVRVFHRYLSQEGIRSDNPAAQVDGVKVPSSLPKALAEEDVARLLNAVTGVDSFARRDRALLEFLYATGARVAEVCGLSMGDIDMQDSLVRLFGKGAKERIVPFGRPCHAALTDYFDLGGRPTLVPDRWASREDSDSVFLGVHGTRLSRQAAWTIVRKYGEIAKIKKLSPHALRHSCATHMLVHGADLRVVQELLGHASVSTTQIYTKVDNHVLWEMYREAHPRAQIKS